MTVTEVRRESVGEEKEALKVADWLYKCEKTLDFFFDNQPDDITEEAVAQAEYEEQRLGDPYGSMLEKELLGVEEHSTGEEVGPSALRGKPRRLVVRPKEGDLLVGRWVKGGREGPGNISSVRLEKGGVKAVVGTYTRGRLEGQAKMVMADGACRHCWVQRGWLHGPCRGVRQDGEQKLSYLGHYAAGAPKGVCWTAIKGGGWMLGRLDSKAEYTGDNIAFLYPDLSTALVGTFLRGILVSARSAAVSSSTMVDGVLVPSFSFLSDQKFSFWPSTIDRVLCPPHQRDPYESRLVRVGTSRMEGGGEGLFAKRFIASGTIVAFYNGVRIGQEDPNPHGTTGYCIFVDWGKQLPFPFPWVKEGEQIDIPGKYQDSQDYTATLAHKVNHSFSTNCEFTNFCHPCYGLLPAIIATSDVAKDEELFTNYSLDMKEAPEWYLSCWELAES